jgi:hypothetical protein
MLSVTGVVIWARRRRARRRTAVLRVADGQGAARSIG